MFNILHIDTTDSTITRVGIQKGKETQWYEEKTGETKSQNVLQLIKKALASEKLELTDLTKIMIITGPGSFTGIRVGVTVANVLGWELKIPVNGKKIATPQYQASKFD